VTHTFINTTPELTQLSGEFSLDSFLPEGLVGIGVPIGTVNFVRPFVDKTWRDVIEDVENLDTIEDNFIHYQLLRFSQTTRLQYINSHIILDNHCVLHQQHVDCKIADAFLKKGTKQHADGWDEASKDWAHMVLHLPHTEGGFGVPFNCVTKDAAFYTTTSRFVSWMGAFSQERQKLWLPKDDLRDSSSWSWVGLRNTRPLGHHPHTPTLVFRSSLQLSLYRFIINTVCLIFGWRKCQIDPGDDHLYTCTVHSGAKKVHDWSVDQLTDLFRTTTKVKMEQVVKNRGQDSGTLSERDM